MLLPMSLYLPTNKANTMVYKTFSNGDDEYEDIQFHDVKSSSRLAPSEHKQIHFNQHSACSYNVSSNGENSIHKFDDDLLFQDQEQPEEADINNIDNSNGLNYMRSTNNSIMSNKSNAFTYKTGTSQLNVCTKDLSNKLK